MTTFFSQIAVDNALLSEVQCLYESAFPCDERRPFAEFTEILATDSRFSVRAAIDATSGKMLGFISYWNLGPFCYLEHFATIPEMRGKGLGATAMNDFFCNVSGRIILEVEPPTDDLSRRRIGFYERLGLTLWPDFHYIQPAYAPHLQPLELKLMTRGSFTTAELTAAVAAIKAAVYKVAGD